MSEENNLLVNKHILLIPSNEAYIPSNFCGVLCQSLENLKQLKPDEKTIVFSLLDKNNLTIPSEYKQICLNNVDQLPINIHNVGVYFKEFLPFTSKDYYANITQEHVFQSLSESNKPNEAYRKGIYLTEVKEDGVFHLLRCSSNLRGPTDNFRISDHEIVGQVNQVGKLFFEQEVQFNHVLAQVYLNHIVDGKEKKAKIKSHSDKTKDMPKNGLIAFCTFYDHMEENPAALTRLRFKLKEDVLDKTFVKMFDLVLHQNSLFIISLKTNRLYTHEIIPSILDISKIPIRIGYVIRCSNVEAKFDEETKCTRIISSNNEKLVPLNETSTESKRLLKDFYSKENITSDFIEYPEIDFSFNEGDYMCPSF